MFGESTFSFYIFTISIGLATAIVIYQVGRNLGFVPVWALMVTVAFIGGSNIVGTRSIGAIGVYTPSWPVGLFGLSLIMLGLTSSKPGGRRYGGGAIALGVAIALLSKHEFAAGVIVWFGVLVVYIGSRGRSEWWIRAKSYAAVSALVGFGIATIIYLAFFLTGGIQDVIAGVMGYSQGMVFPANYASMGEELVQAMAGVTALTTMFAIGVGAYRSGEQNRNLVVTTTLVLVVLISFAGEFLSRGSLLNGVALYALSFIVVVLMEVTRRRGGASSPALYPSYLMPLVLVISTLAYELISAVGDDHELLLMAPVRLAPWVAVFGACALVWFFFKRDNHRDPAENQRLFIVMSIVALAAGVESRFILDSGSPAVYTVSIFASAAIIFFAVTRWVSALLPEQGSLFKSINIPSAILIAVVLPTILFVSAGKPALAFVRNDPESVQTHHGPLVVKGSEAPTIEAVLSVIKTFVPEDSAVTSTAFTPWVNYVADRPGMLPVTQTQILKLDDEWVDAAIAALEGNPPVLIVEDLVNVDDPIIGGWGAGTRSSSPWLWEFVGAHYQKCAHFQSGDPRDGLWGANFFVLTNPDDDGFSCDTFRLKTKQFFSDGYGLTD